MLISILIYLHFYLDKSIYIFNAYRILCTQVCLLDYSWSFFDYILLLNTITHNITNNGFYYA